jgi:hypothetical protein
MTDHDAGERESTAMTRARKKLLPPKCVDGRCTGRPVSSVSGGAAPKGEAGGCANRRNICRLFAGEEKGRLHSSSISCIDLNFVMFCFDAAAIGENRIARGHARLFRKKRNLITIRRLARDKPSYHQDIWLHRETP